jgi:hypothetical protein
MGKLVFPGEWLIYVKILTVIDVKLFMVQSVATRISKINQSINILKKEKTTNCRILVRIRTNNFTNILLYRNRNERSTNIKNKNSPDHKPYTPQ